jgi:hypothetical protein
MANGQLPTRLMDTMFDDAGRNVPLMKLGPCQCRFPVREDASVPGGHRFCAVPTAAGRVYCDQHHSIVTAIEPRRTRPGYQPGQRRAA